MKKKNFEWYTNCNLIKTNLQVLKYLKVNMKQTSGIAYSVNNTVMQDLKFSWQLI